jgi:hypothetical protein
MQQVQGKKESASLLPAATTKVVTSYDYQHELVITWSNHLETDTSGILEKSINHGDDCKCCSPNTAASIRGRVGRY